MAASNAVCSSLSPRLSRYIKKDATQLETVSMIAIVPVHPEPRLGRNNRDRTLSHRPAWSVRVSGSYRHRRYRQATFRRGCAGSGPDAKHHQRSSVLSQRLYFGIGMVPGLIATVIFVLPAPIRLTHLLAFVYAAPLLEAAADVTARPSGKTAYRICHQPCRRLMAGLNQRSCCPYRWLSSALVRMD
jgi:hypothetical protein